MTAALLLPDVFGNALGNSIVDGMSKEAATVDRLAKRGFKGEFDPSGYGNSALDNLTLEDLSGPSLSSNPSNAVYQPAMALTADEQRNGTIDPVAAMELQREITREEAGRGHSVSGGMGQEAQWPTDPAILAQYDRWADINAKNGPLAIEVTRGAEEEPGLLSRVAQGAGHAAVDLVTQPFAQLHDLGAIGYDIFDNTFLGDQSNPNYWSNIGRYEQSGEVTTEGRILNLVGAVPVLNVGAMSYQGTTSLLNGDYGGFAEQVGGLGVGFATGGVIGRYGSRSLQSPLTLELQSGATAYSGVPIGLRSPFAADVAAPSFGRFSSASEFGDESFRRYQQFVDEGYDLARAAEARGSLSGLSNTRVGTYVDRYSRDAFNDWLMSEGLGEGAGGSVQMNRWLRDPQGSGSYARPDIRIPGANLILDATVGEKWSTTPQIINFKNFSGGDRITIVRPTQLGGSYSVWPKE